MRDSVLLAGHEAMQKKTRYILVVDEERVGVRGLFILSILRHHEGIQK